MTARARRLLGAVVLLALLGPLVVDWLWVSDEEKVVASLDAMERALEARDGPATAAWFASEVKLARPLPGINARVPLAEGLTALLAQLSQLKIDRDDTQVAFAEDGTAAVTISGTFFLEHEKHGAMPFKFRLQTTLREDGDRYLLQSLDSFTFGPLFG